MILGEILEQKKRKGHRLNPSKLKRSMDFSEERHNIYSLLIKSQGKKSKTTLGRLKDLYYQHENTVCSSRGREWIFPVMM
jgi:hypothetical protein